MSHTNVPALKQHKIPFFVPSIGEEEIESVVETLRSGWLTTGPKTKQFETQFAEKVGARHAAAVSSATSALHLALEAVGVSRGDEVLVPTMTFASTGEVVVHLGATPVLVDCHPGTLNMDVDQIEKKITERTKAVIPVHYGGQPCEMDRILHLARKHNLKVIEDAAHALPARYGDQTVGTIGDVSCFSFYANKTMTTGEGGMVTTDNDELAARMRMMSLHGISKDAWKRFSAEGSWYYEILAPGYKFNMTDIAASLGLHQLAKCDDFRERRAQVADWYNQELGEVTEVAIPFVELNIEHAWHLYVIQLQLDRISIDRNEFICRLNRAGIGTSVHYTPLHMHPFYQERYGYRSETLPAAASVYRRIISLPIYPSLERDSVEYIASTIKQIVAENRISESARVEALALASTCNSASNPPQAPPGPRGVSLFAKRTFDVLASLLGLVLLSPLLFVVAILTKLTSRGPILFRQERMGRNFRRFNILKFRTMVPNASELGGQLTAGKDSRITPIGSLLRAAKIDELPQLINVFRGDMSFVGPRPEVPRYVEMFRADYEQLLTIRPGITDPASLKYRHESEILGGAQDPERTYVEEILPDKIVLAKEYIRRSSLWFDFLLIFRTVCRMVS